MAGKPSAVTCISARVCCAVIAVLTLCATATAQTLPFREYTVDDGLPQSETMGVFQDSRGYLWIPTRNGLARFDGNEFKNYYRKDGLPSNVVSGITEDSDGVIWAITSIGLARFNGTKFHGYPAPDSMSLKQIGLACTFTEPGKFILNARAIDQRKKIIIFDNGSYLDMETLYPVLRDREFKAEAFNQADSILYITNPDSALYSLRNGKLTLLDNGPILEVWMEEGKLMLSTGRNIFAYNGPGDKTDRSLPYRGSRQEKLPDYNTPEALVNFLIPGNERVKWTNGRIQYTFTDREGVLWIFTETKIYRLVSDAFTEYDGDSGLPETPWAIAANPAGGLFIGSLHGELKYFDGGVFTEKARELRINGAKPTYYRGSTTLSNGEIWFSTQTGVIVYDGKKFRTLKLDEGGIQVCIIWEDPVDKTVFVGTDRGLYHVKGEKVTFYNEMSWPDKGIVEGIARDDHGNYWLGGHYGMAMFDGKVFTSFHSASAPVEMVWGVIKDYRGNIWSAGSDGIFICDPDNPDFIPALPVAENLPANVIRNMGDRRLLVGRMLDLCIIDLEKYYSGQLDYYTFLGRNRGFEGNDCQDNGIVRDAAGKWWVLTSTSLIKFEPEKLTLNRYQPLTHITLVESQTNNKGWSTILDSSLYFNRKHSVTLKGSNNSLRVTFTGISMRNPEEVTFQYRVKGHDENWSQKSRERSVILNELPPGQYTFELISFNGDGLKTLEPETLSIKVVPTFFQTLGAKIGLALLAISLIVFLSFQTRRRILEKRVRAAQVQAESYKMQLNSVIKQFDPHFTFNAVTSIGSLIMKGEKEKAYNYFIKLSNLLRSVLTDSSVLLKPLSDEIDFVTRYCELQKLRFSERFSFEIKTDADVDRTTPVPKMIIQSFVENSVKHGLENKKGEGRVNIYISRLKNGLGIIVRDNGIGRHASSVMQTGGGGLGLKNISSLIDTLNRGNNTKITFNINDLYDDNKPSGTEVSIFIPQPYNFDL